MSVGIVVTSRVTHATLAAYYCHIEDRGLDNEIMEHLVYQDIDVVFGGGAGYLIPENETLKTKFGDTWKGKRVDGENLMKVLLDRKYTFIDNKSDMKKFSGKKVWGLFDDSHLDPDIDRDNFHPNQPSLAEMTEKAIEILYKNPKGFFLMVEGSQVDWAAHANDAVYMTYDFLAFDDAVKVACDFADKNKNTTVIAFPDHNTGALALGHEQSSFPPKYTATSLEALIDPIKNAKITIQGLLSLLPKDTPPTFEEFVDIMKKEIGGYWEVLRNKDYKKQADEVYKAALSGSNKSTSTLLSKYFTVYGWTTNNHTGEDVPVWTYGVQSNLFEKTIDNTDLAKKVAEILKINLSEISKNLFNDIKVTFPDAVITDTPGNATCELIPGVKIYEGKDIISIKGKDHELKGICVHAPKINTFFIPKEAFTIIPAFALGKRK